MGRLAYSEPRRCLALSHCYVVRRVQRLSSGYSFLGPHYSPAGPAGDQERGKGWTSAGGAAARPPW
jgi:hypothetical protein